MMVSQSKVNKAVKLCAKNTDEMDCKIIDFGDNVYQAQYPAFDRETQVCNVTVNINVTYIDNIDENSNIFTVKILLQMSWFDSRLHYRNLNANRTQGNSAFKSETEKESWNNFNPFCKLIKSFIFYPFHCL